MVRPFDLATVSLEGRNLVEASAGTGKTYSLAGLFLRLVVEAGLGVDQILVVTFTEAATEELRGRIRGRLREAQSAFRSGDAGGDALLSHLLTHPETLRGRAPERLAAALRCFDDAAISTIHGFCQRVLGEQAFECGVALGAEVLPDPSALVEELVADHWRQRLHGASAGFARYVAGRNQGLEDLAKFVRTWAGRPGLEVVPTISDADADPGVAEGTARRRFDAVAELWRAHRGAVFDLLTGDPALVHRKLSKKSVSDMAAALDAYLAGDDLLAEVKWIERFGGAFLAGETRPGFEAPRHPFLDACEALLRARAELEEAYRMAWVAFRAELLAFAETELPVRMARQGVRTFDDLLREVHRALTGPGGERLADALRTRFRAALIDEFQDTDPLQYEIFRRVFATAPEPRLFLIGDPKQAIYGFRGADLFAYLGAVRAADDHFTLGENWRSTPGLLAAVEQLFHRGANPFILDDIGFVRVAAGGGGKPPLVIDGDSGSEPLQVWWIDGDADGRPPAKGRVVPLLCRATAAEVLRLVTAGQEGRATVAGAPLEPGQVAVLVRTHDQARGVQQALAARRIPSVIASSESLFATAEAREVLAFLAAAAEPAHEGRVRAALATELVGLSARELHALREDERRWEAWLERFRHCHELWWERGLVAALRGALAELGVRERLLAYPDGERRVTNVLHLVEVLHAGAGAGHLGPEAVVGWLGRRVAERVEAEEYQLRLETDEQAVQVVTVHRSKGLEYPVVLCPFLWEGLRGDKGDDSVACHDPADPTRMILDLGSEDFPRHRDLARWEALAERVRLAYVALTRARQRCYLAWGAVNQGEDAALGYLLHAPPEVRTAAPEVLVGELAASAQTGRDRYREELARLAADSGGTLRVAEAPLPPPAEIVFHPREDAPAHLERRSPPAAIPRDWGVTSYSGLTAGRAEGAEHPDRDEGTAAPSSLPTPDLAARPRADIFGFPRGARAGTCLHAILEALEFSAADGTTLEAVTEKQLRDHGFDPGWTPAVVANLSGVLSAPLLGDPLLGADDFRLRDLPGTDRLTELEFHLPLGRVTPAGLARCLADGPDLPPGLAAAAVSLGFRPLRGLLKGFVDLVFRHRGRYYLLDWKSNHLGDGVEQYGPAALARAMDEHHYHLQYLLYAAALHRYLGHRLPGYRYADHFGGAVYVFLRGVDPEGRTGIFRARPAEARVDALARYLEQGEDGHG